MNEQSIFVVLHTHTSAHPKQSWNETASSSICVCVYRFLRQSEVQHVWNGLIFKVVRVVKREEGEKRTRISVNHQAQGDIVPNRVFKCAKSALTVV